MLSLRFPLLFFQVPSALGQNLLAPTREWMDYLKHLNSDTHGAKPIDPATAYLNLLAGILSSSSLECDPAQMDVQYLRCLDPFRRGQVTPRVGITMAGHKRMQNIKELMMRVHESQTKGCYLEAGVWRGGMSVFAAAVVEAYGMNRSVYLCDSYQGLPPPRKGSLRADESVYTDNPTFKALLSKGEEEVVANFRFYGVPLTKVRTIRGFFVDSLPVLRDEFMRRGEKISVLRLDGDMYDSTIDILYNLYDLVEVLGFIVIDDWGWAEGTSVEKARWGAKAAILDFRSIHRIEDAAHVIHDVDGTSAWFQKARQVKLLRSLYLESLQTGSYEKLQPQPKLTRTDYLRLMNLYDAHNKGTSRGGRTMAKPVQRNPYHSTHITACTHSQQARMPMTRFVPSGHATR